MSLSAKIRRAPLRATTGAYILSSGFDKIQAGDEQAKGLHGFAASAYPVFEKVQPKVFTRALGVAEMSLGAALLLPVVPPVAVGVGLAAFSGGLLGLYWRTPGMHRAPNDPRPTQDGMAIAKDTWMLGIGAGIVADSILGEAHEKRLEVQHKVSKRAAVGSARMAGRRSVARERLARHSAVGAERMSRTAAVGGERVRGRSRAALAAGHRLGLNVKRVLPTNG